MKTFVILACALWAALPALAADSSPSSPPARDTPVAEHGKSARSELSIRVWSVPPYLTCQNWGVGGPPPAVKVPENQPQEDARGWLMANHENLQFDAEELAIIDPRLRILVVRAKQETLDRVDKFMREAVGVPNSAYRRVQVEVSLVEFHVAKIPDSNEPIPYKTLRQIAGNSWQVLHQLQAATELGKPLTVVSSTSGTKAAVPTQGASASETAASDLRPIQSGATLEVEATQPLDGSRIEVNLAYRFQSPGDAPEWKTKCNLNVPLGYPVVLQVASVESGDRSAPAKSRALILRCDLLDSADSKTAPLPKPRKASGGKKTVR